MTKPFVPCDKCKDSKHPGYVEHVVHGYVGRGAMKLVECDCHLEWVKLARGERLIRESGLPNYNYKVTDYLGARSVRSLEAVKRVASEWEKRPEFRSTFMYMYGPNGCQKTALADWLGKELCMKGVVVKFVPVREFATKLRRSFVEDGFKVDLEHLQAADFLILDEMFDTTKVTVTDWFIPFLDAFLRERVEYLKKTVLTISNVAPNDISPKFGESLKNFVERHTKRSTLLFQDDYWAIHNGDVGWVYDEKTGLFG